MCNVQRILCIKRTFACHTTTLQFTVHIICTVLPILNFKVYKCQTLMNLCYINQLLIQIVLIFFFYNSFLRIKTWINLIECVVEKKIQNLFYGFK